MSKLTYERGKLENLLKRQAKEQQARSRKKPGSLRRRQAKARLLRLKGLIRISRNRLSELRKKARKRGPGAAVRWALEQEGITEHPPNSNWGEPVQTWIKNTGYSQAVPWCGCFVHEAVVEKGRAKIPNGIRLGYNGYIAQDADAGQNGLKEVPYGSAHKGDIVVFDFPHIGLVRGRPDGERLPTIEGNTSPLSSGSQFNGGAVAAKTRARSEVRLVARPKYP